MSNIFDGTTANESTTDDTPLSYEKILEALDALGYLPEIPKYDLYGVV